MRFQENSMITEDSRNRGILLRKKVATTKIWFFATIRVFWRFRIKGLHVPQQWYFD